MKNSQSIEKTGGDGLWDKEEERGYISKRLNINAE